MARGRKGKQDHVLGTFGVGASTPLRWQMINSVAYKVLTPAYTLVLNDMLREVCGPSRWDTERVPEGFTFTYGQCIPLICEKTFYRAIERICEVGFFKRPIEIQEHRPAAPYRFIPCSDWERYKPTADERRKLHRLQAAKKRRLAQKKVRRTDFRASLGQSEGVKSTPTSTGQNDADSS